MMALSGAERDIMPILPLWAVHIGDVLSWPWVVAGFVVAGLLAAVACWRVSEDEVPRIALLTAAFFVASSIHVNCGPTSVHLLLAGLVGILLGWRAPLAILCGTTLQALLVSHGGLSTIGVNTCVQAIPALAAGGLYHALRSAEERSGWMQNVLLAVSALAWGACLLLGVGLIWTQSLSGLVRWDSQAGLILSGSLAPAFAFLAHPVSLGLLVAFPIGAVCLRGIVELPRSFALGLFVGILSVLGTLLLLGAVLVLDRAEKWGTFVSLVFVVHLPLALLEGVLVGMTVSFLTRVKPALLGARPVEVPTPPATELAPARGGGVVTAPPVLAVLALLLFGGTASAHGLEANYSVDCAAHRVTVTVFYETGDAPREGKVKVTAGAETIAEGETDREGKFEFSYERIEPLLVSVRSEGGHSSRFAIRAAELEGAAPQADSHGRRLGDIMAGVALVLALGALVLAWLNSRRLSRIEENLNRTNP
jgi:cobalt/nickel transport system permease protein